MNRLRFVLSSRGLKNTVARTRQVASRFGLTAARMERRLLAYREIVGEYGEGPSLPITASVLDRNPHIARRLGRAGVELCVHGLIHTDMSRLDGPTQEEHIRMAVEVFKRHAVPFEGFRSPYLRYNGATLAAVAKAGFKYDSNLPFYWEPGESLRNLTAQESDGLKRGLRFYDPVKYPADRSLPRYIGGLIEIPVALPDDEILMDRMGLPAGRIGEVWTEMAAKALERHELLTLQLHPERLFDLEVALRRVLGYAREAGSFWLAGMREIASWWEARTQASADIAPAGRGIYKVTGRGPAGLGLKVVEPLAGLVRDLEPGGTVRSAAKPVVGISASAAPSLRTHLRQLGYFIEITDDTEAVNLHLGPGTEPAEAERLVGRCGDALIADTIWPVPYAAALAVTGDIDCLTIGDFLRRFTEG